MSEENKFFVVLDYCFQRLIMPADGPYICLPSQQMPQCYKSLLKRETIYNVKMDPASALKATVSKLQIKSFRTERLTAICTE